MSNSPQAKKILIVDDEPAVVSYLEMLLRDSGYETLSASNGQEAIEMVRRERPDLVSLDISMPEASGTRFYRDIKKEPGLAAIPVVIVTAVTGYGGDKYAYKEFISHSRLVPPPEAYFPKPIDRDKFLEAIQKLLA